MNKSGTLFHLFSPWHHKPVVLVLSLLALAAGLSCSFAGLLAWDVLDQAFTLVMGPEEGRGDWIVVGKKADLRTLVTPDSAGFDTGECAVASGAPGVRQVAPVACTRVPVDLGARIGDSRMGTEIFFEAPDPRVLGYRQEQWTWHEGESVPLMLPRSFLALFNMGYAGSRGLPAIPENMLSAVPLRIRAETPRGTREFDARVQGLTDRFSSFIAPREFVNFLNGDLPALPRRLALQVDDPDDARLSVWLQNKGWEIHDGTRGLGQARTIARVLGGLFSLVGGVLWASALLAFLQQVSGWLSLQESHRRAAFLLGYPETRIRRATSLHLILLQVPLVLPLPFLWFAALHLSASLGGILGAGVVPVPGLLAPALAILQSGAQTALALFSIRKAGIA